MKTSKYKVIKETLLEIGAKEILVKKTKDCFIRITFMILGTYYTVDYPYYRGIEEISEEIKKHFKINK